MLEASFPYQEAPLNDNSKNRGRTASYVSCLLLPVISTEAVGLPGTGQRTGSSADDSQQRLSVAHSKTIQGR